MKAVLVIDMPETCFECPLAMWEYETLLTSNKHMKNSLACVLTHKKITGTKRNRFCPLKEMPEKREVENAGTNYGEEPWFSDGWNACIEEIER